MSATREFHLGDILSITTGRLVSPRHIEGIYDLLGYMTGEKLWTHQLPRAMRECAPVLLQQHPALASVEMPDDIHPDSVPSWVAQRVMLFGKTLPVAPLAGREPQYDTPVADAIEMMGGDTSRVVVIGP